ncbi:MAG: hypothetical protein HY654_05405 [Acidobacteria bacterium]|nr:hypothetical protein [Acidobacteriota bacterium]
MMVVLLIAALAIPLGLDLYMPVSVENPITPEKIELGRRLFNDRRLSRDGSIACASCHDPARAFSDGRHIAFIEPGTETSTLYAMPVDGGPKRELFRAAAPAPLGTVAEWTRDGRRLVFASKNTYWIIPSGGGAPVRLELEKISAANSLRIHPDGHHAAFNAGSRTSEVWMLENFLPAATTKK